MDFDITKVTIDGDVDDLSEDSLRELVRQFRDAQDSNVAEFERALEAEDDVDEDTIQDFEEAREDLIEDITGAEAFGEVPVSEDVLEDREATSFSDLQDWKEFVAETPADEDEGGDEGGEGEGDFDDMGTQAPVDGGDDEVDFAEEELADMPGLNL